MASLVQVLVDRKLLGVVHAHAETDRVATGDIAILLSAVQLVLLLVIAMDQVFRASPGKPLAFDDTIGVKLARSWACRIGGGDVGVNIERLVREVATEGGRRGRIGTGGRLRGGGGVDVVLLQTGVGPPGPGGVDS